MDSNGYNESLFPTGRCLICGSQGDLVRHEVFHGSRRTASKKWGCWVTVCPTCHAHIHRHPISYTWLQDKAQRKAMEKHGWTEEEFRNVFGKSYLEIWQ